MQRKPRVFIGCSVESLKIADSINSNLDHDTEVTIWRNGTFHLTNGTLDSLIEKAMQVDFSVFIFSPDDIAIIKEAEKKVVRDNVIFELGLFIGTIGKNRCYIVKPRNVDLHFPTDLIGLTTVDFESQRSDGDLDSALNYACSQIKKEIEKLGTIEKGIVKSSRLSEGSNNDNISSSDLFILSKLMKTFTSTPEGYSFYEINKQLNLAEHQVQLGIVRLLNGGYCQKQNATDMDGSEYYSYIITQDGVNLLLGNEGVLDSFLKTGNASNSASKVADDLPF